MNKLTIKTATEDDFFQRGRELSKALDRSEPIVAERIVSFEDPAEVVKLITKARLALFRAVKESPGSITQISQRLHRDRSAILTRWSALVWLRFQTKYCPVMGE